MNRKTGEKVISKIDMFNQKYQTWWKCYLVDILWLPRILNEKPAQRFFRRWDFCTK